MSPAYHEYASTPFSLTGGAGGPPNKQTKKAPPNAATRSKHTHTHIHNRRHIARSLFISRHTERPECAARAGNTRGKQRQTYRNRAIQTRAARQHKRGPVTHHSRKRDSDLNIRHTWTKWGWGHYTHSYARARGYTTINCNGIFFCVFGGCFVCCVSVFLGRQ